MSGSFVVLIVIFVVAFLMSLPVVKSLLRSQKENMMKLKLSLRFSFLAIMCGGALIFTPYVNFEAPTYSVSNDVMFIMSMTAMIAKKMIGGLLVAAGLLSLTISEIFNKPSTDKTTDGEP